MKPRLKRLVFGQESDHIHKSIIQHVYDKTKMEESTKLLMAVIIKCKSKEQNVNAVRSRSNRSLHFKITE